jgi:hypothetical protein
MDIGRAGLGRAGLPGVFWVTPAEHVRLDQTLKRFVTSTSKVSSNTIEVLISHANHSRPEVLIY